MKRAILEDIHKIFETRGDTADAIQRFTALDGVTLAFFPGEIHTIIGENGAGKSTLVSILSGLHQPTKGCIRVGGQNICFTSPSDALTAGIAMVHQRPLLSDEITVLENILIGTGGFFLRKKDRRKKILTIARAWNIEINLDARAGMLNASQRLFAALLGALYAHPDFLILDEPTAVLSDSEKELFFDALQREKARGVGIILITHKMNEAVRISDRVSVLSRGKLIFSSTIRERADSAPITEQFLENLIDPETRKTLSVAKRANISDPHEHIKTIPIAHDDTNIAFAVSGITAEPANKNPLRDITFTARRGEITGIFGLPGSGIETLENVLSGMLRADAGSLTVGEKTYTAREINPAVLRMEKIGIVPSNRTFRGSYPELSLFDFLTVYRSSNFFLHMKENAAFVRELLAGEQIDAPPSRLVQTLSGGQLQRLILARELAQNPTILILAQMEWGLDIHSASRLRDRLRQEAKNGMTIIILTDTLDQTEDAGFYSRTLTLREGRLS